MGNQNYAPLVRDMVWSFSRISAFEDCPYRWYLSYIREKKGDDMFYASYGSFMHGILADYYAGKLSADELPGVFLSRFRDDVRGARPSPEIAARYVEEGSAYLRSPFRPDGEIIGVEKRVRFSVYDKPFVGTIDLLVRDERGFVLIDHKSRAMKPRSGKSKPTTTDIEIDEMLKQLYLYAEAVQQEFGETPYKLCFNCFRNGVLIEEPFDERAFVAAKDWAREEIERIEAEDEFEADPEWFRCRYLCGYHTYCDEWRE